MQIGNRRKVNRLVCLLLVLCMMLGAIPTTALADNLESGAPVQTEEATPAPEQEQPPEPEQTPEQESSPKATTEQTPVQTTEPSAEPTQSLEPSAEPEEPEDPTYENSISGMLWYDENDDGVRNSGEEPIAGYPVNLYKANDTGKAVQTATTDENGKYSFSNMEPGSYVAGVKSNELGTDYYLLPVVGVTGDNKLGTWSDEWDEKYSEPIEVAEDTVVAGINAGLRTPPGIQPTAIWTVSGLGSYSSLPLAIAAINAASAGSYTVSGGGSETINASMTISSSNKNITINPSVNGVVITQTAADYPIFTITSGNSTLTLQNITLDGNGIADGIQCRGTLIMDAGATIKNCYKTVGNGAAVQIHTSGNFTMNDGSEISGNTLAGIGDYGGGVYLGGNSQFTMNGGTISGNTANYGGGVSVANNVSLFIMNGGIISGNTANYGGGVSVPYGSFTMNGGTIGGTAASEANTATEGGGIYVGSGRTVSLPSGSTGKIIGNTATNGGGVYVGGTFTISSGLGVVDSNSVTGNGGGIYTLSAGSVNLNAGSVTNNAAPSGNGGGVYTGNTNNYANLNIASGVTFSGNTARQDALPPLNASTMYPNIATTTSSIYTHPLNNYDINRAFYVVTVHYVDRSGVAIGTPTLNAYDVIGGNSFFLTSAQIPTITGYGFADWKIGASGTLEGNTTVSLTSVTANTDIYLVYGLDRGATGDDPTDPGTTPDGIEDIVVTKDWYDTVGAFNMRSTEYEVINVGDTFAETYLWIIGYDYQGYRIDSGALQPGSPSIATLAGDSDFTITYVYSRQDYQISVNYALRDGSAVPGKSSFTRSAGFNTTYAPTAAEQQVPNYVLVDWLWNGTSMNNTSPSITVPLGGATITLVYGRDSGASGDIGGGTPNGTEDFDVTRKWEMSDGSAIAGLPSQVQIWDVGDTFTLAHNSGVTIPIGLDYQGYRLSTDAPGDPLHSGAPNYTVNTTDSDVTVTYVYSKTQYAVTIHFIDRAGNPIGSPTTTTTQADHGDPYTAAAQTISGYTFVDWKIGSMGTLAGNTSPTVANILGTTDIYLVYGRDSGTTGDINGGGSETPNGTEDFDVTRMWQMQGGGSISGLGGQVVIMDVGDSFTMAHNTGVTIPAGLTYEGYRIGGGSLQAGTPGEAVTVAKGNFTVTYEYSTTRYEIKVNYEDRAGTVLAVTDVFTNAVAHGQSYTPADPGFTGKVLVGWYSGAPVSNPTVLNLPATLNNVMGDAEITLVYGKDNVKADDTAGTDGVEDFTITKKWETMTSTTLHGPISMDLNVGKVFNTAHNADVNLAASGWTYQGYYLSTDGGATLHSGVPNVAVLAANGDFTVTYVYARTTFTMTVNYVDRNAVTQQASINPSAVYGDPFQPTIPVISGKVYVGWYLGAPNTSSTVLTTTPQISSVTGADEITLVYGKDSGGGGTSTPDGTEDFDVTREWKMQNGTAIAGLPTITEPWNVGETFNKAHNAGVTIPAGLTYVGFKYDTDAAGDPIRTGTPSITITVAGGDRGVTYYYTTTSYTINVSYEYLSNAGATSSLPGGQTAGILHGSNFNTATTPALLVPDYPSAPGTTDLAFRYKTYIGYTVDGGAMQTGLPGLSNVTAGHNIVLVYAQDMNENGTRDYTITETHKSGATTLATNTVYADEGTAYNGAVNAAVIASGYTYDSYAIVSGASGTAPALPMISNVQADTTVNMEYLLNGYAVGVTYRYDANSGSSTVLTGSQNVSINHGDNFNAGSTPQLKIPTAIDHTDFDQKVLIDWELDGVAQGNTSPGIMSVTGPHSIVLVFAQDMDRNGTRDYTITEKFQTEAGGTIMADNEVYVNENNTYTMADPDVVLPSGSGSYYTKYNLDGGADSATAVKPVTISTVSADHTVIYKYLPNNYTVTVVYEYHKNDGTVQVLGSGQTASITHGNAFDAFSTPALAQPTFPSVVYSGWKLNGVTQTGTLGIASVTNAAAITLVYYQDMDGDGTRDYTITENHITPNVADNTTYSRYINEGDPYSAGTDPLVTSNGYTYTDYIVTNGTTVTGFAPAAPSIAAVNTEYTVTLNYVRTLYTVNVTYQYKANNGSVTTLPGSQTVQIAHGGNFDTMAPVGNELVIPDYLAAPGTTDPAFQYKVLASWTLDGTVQTGTPGLTNVTGSHNIVLVYVQDMDEDGTPDITVTKQFINGHTNAALKADQTVYVNIGTLFNDGADAITGWTYDHHVIDGGTPSAQYALPSFTPALGDADTVVEYVYMDVTAPAPPVINTVGDSDTIVTGTGDEPGNTITVTWPDSSTSTATVQPDGTWSVNVPGSVTLDAGDTISATETDPYNNVSGPGTTTVIDNTPPAAPIINSVKETDTKVKGTGDEPGNTITVTWPDNTTSTTTVKPDGTWEVNVPGGMTLSPNDTITATETDPSGNVSSPSNAIVGVTTYLISVTYEYHANDGSVITLPGNQATQAVRNNNFTAAIPTASTHSAFDQKVLIGWKLDGGAMQIGTPQLSGVTQAHTLVLIFAQDMDRDGTPDITVTKQFLWADGTVLKPSQTVIVNQGGTFTDAHDTITGYDYQGFKLDSGSLQSGEPNLLVGAITRAATTVRNDTVISYIYTPTQYNITVKVVDENGNSINSGAYDWTASKSYQESFMAAAPTVQGYTYQSWKLNDTQQSGSIEISSVTGAATILLVYQKQAAPPVTPDYGNYEFIKVPNVKNVAAGETVKYTFTKFGNNWPFELQDYVIADIPDKGLDFVSASLPAFTSGTGVTYDIVYRTNKTGTTTLYSDIPADQPFSFKAPSLSSGEYITSISLRFGTVPVGFAAGDSMSMTFKVWDNPPSETLTNIGILGYTADGEYMEFITGGASGTITIGGYFGTPKTGDDSNMVLWSALMALSLGGAVLLPVVRRRRKHSAQK